MLDRPTDPRAIIRVQTWKSTGAGSLRLGQQLGLDWPIEVGSIASCGVDVLCIGPTDWLVVAAEADSESLLRSLGAALEESTYRATNVSQALARVAIDGPQARLLLAKGCSLDLHVKRFPPERCARTRLAGMPVVVCCVREFAFDCIVASSYREYLGAWIADAGVEFSAPSPGPYGPTLIALHPK